MSTDSDAASFTESQTANQLANDVAVTLYLGISSDSDAAYLSIDSGTAIQLILSLLFYLILLLHTVQWLEH